MGEGEVEGDIKLVTVFINRNKNLQIWY